MKQEPQHIEIDLTTLELLSIPGVAKEFHISVRSVYRLQEGRHVPFFKIGRAVRFARSDVAAYLEKHILEPFKLVEE